MSHGCPCVPCTAVRTCRVCKDIAHTVLNASIVLASQLAAIERPEHPARQLTTPHLHAVCGGRACTGTDKTKVTRLADQELFSWWMMPRQTEHVFFDTDPPTNATIPISLWNLGNK